jgi:hypothetical protein
MTVKKENTAYGFLMHMRQKSISGELAGSPDLHRVEPLVAMTDSSAQECARFSK